MSISLLLRYESHYTRNTVGGLAEAGAMGGDGIDDPD